MVITMKPETYRSVQVPSAGEQALISDGIERAKPQAEEEFDLQAYLNQFPLPLNGTSQ